jgi:hypothetical protein
LYLDTDGINALVKEYEQDTKALKEELLRICWYMRGGVQYSEAHLMTYEEREIVNKIVEGNLQTTKDTQLPFF